jgi:hypothetical protein
MPNGRKEAPTILVPGTTHAPGFDIAYGNFDTLSAVCLRSSPCIIPAEIFVSAFPSMLTTATVVSQQLVAV